MSDFNLDANLTKLLNERKDNIDDDLINQAREAITKRNEELKKIPFTLPGEKKVNPTEFFNNLKVIVTDDNIEYQPPLTQEDMDHPVLKSIIDMKTENAKKAYDIRKKTEEARKGWFEKLALYNAKHGNKKQVSEDDYKDVDPLDFCRLLEVTVDEFGTTYWPFLRSKDLKDPLINELTNMKIKKAKEEYANSLKAKESEKTVEPETKSLPAPSFDEVFESATEPVSTETQTDEESIENLTRKLVKKLMEGSTTNPTILISITK